MPRIFPNPVTTTEDKSLVTTCRRTALDAMRAEVDLSGVPKKAIASEVCDGDEPLFSKKLAGAPGRPFSLDDLDKLPRPIVVAWLKRYGLAVGVKVVDLEPGEVTERLLMLVDELATVAKLSRIVGRPRPAKVKLPEDR